MKKLFTIALAALLALGGCGKGGEDDIATATLSISAASQNSVYLSLSKGEWVDVTNGEILYPEHFFSGVRTGGGYGSEELTIPLSCGYEMQADKKVLKVTFYHEAILIGYDVINQWIGLIKLNETPGSGARMFRLAFTSGIDEIVIGTNQAVAIATAPITAVH